MKRGAFRSTNVHVGSNRCSMSGDTDSLHGISPSKGLPGPRVIGVYKLRRWTSDPANR